MLLKRRLLSGRNLFASTIWLICTKTLATLAVGWFLLVTALYTNHTILGIATFCQMHVSWGPHRCREISFVLKNKFIADSTFALSFWTMNCQWFQRITNILNHHSLDFSVVQINLVNKLFTDINTQSTRTWKQETPITKLFLCLKV